MTEPLLLGWAQTCLGIVTSPSSLSIKPNDDDPQAYLGMDNVEAGSTRITGNEISSRIRSITRPFTPGDTLYGRLRPYLNKVCTPEFEGLASSEFIVFPPSSALAHNFLKYLLNSQSFVAYASSISDGDRPRVKWNQIEDWQFQLPPLAEQERIVAAIEEHFSRIDAAESAAQTALARLDTLRRAILTAAFSGHLVKPLNSSRTSSDASNWDVKELSDLLDHTTGGIWGSKPGEEEVDVNVVRVTELTLNGGLNTATAARRSITHKQYESRLLKKGDILLEKSGGGPTTPVGRVALFDYHTGPAICTNFMQLMRPKHSLIRSKFLFWQLHLWHIQGRTAKLQKGSSNIRNLQTKQYLAEVVSYPDLTRQDQIIAVIEECFSHIDAARVTLERCLQRCNILRRAVLASAFSGRLVKQNPNDEPASVLLERIAAEQPERHTRRKSA